MKIENWFVSYVTGAQWDGEPFEGTLHIYGDVYGARPKWLDGEPIRTSIVRSVVSHKQIRTCNSVYELGKPNNLLQWELLGRLREGN